MESTLKEWTLDGDMLNIQRLAYEAAASAYGVTGHPRQEMLYLKKALWIAEDCEDEKAIKAINKQIKSRHHKKA